MPGCLLVWKTDHRLITLDLLFNSLEPKRIRAVQPRIDPSRTLLADPEVELKLPATVAFIDRAQRSVCCAHHTVSRHELVRRRIAHTVPPGPPGHQATKRAPGSSMAHAALGCAAEERLDVEPNPRSPNWYEADRSRSPQKGA
jgi:hypothetical protein